MQKNKPIHKPKNKNKGKQPAKVTDEDGDPIIRNLKDFVTSIKINHSSMPIYTGGRILATRNSLYAACNSQVAIYRFEEDAVVERIKHVLIF